MSLSLYAREMLPYLQWLAGISIVTFILSIILVPWYIARLPQEYFLALRNEPPSVRLKRHNIALLVLRNILGLIIFTAGCAMLFLPGQGLLTMLIGIFCMTFPGKRYFILLITTPRFIRESLDWTRQKMHMPLFSWPQK
ncbi:MAG: hypothetical protein ABR512_08945 [Desulfopila sp.]